MYVDRKSLYSQLEQLRSSKLIIYITGDRPGLETRIHSEIYDFFVNHLDKIGVVPKISLYLYTRGGVTLAAWSLVNLILPIETRIHSEIYDFFVNHLDKIGVVPKISLYLYTRGGVTLAAWSLVNLIL